MFAKSNLNNMPCTYSGEDACTAASNECCAQNDVVYKYLLANTPPGTIQWNFDKTLLLGVQPCFFADGLHALRADPCRCGEV